MEDGSGLGDAIPALSTERLSILQDQLPCIIKNGIKGEMMEMPAQSHLNAVQISNIIHYLFDQMAKNPIRIPVQEIEKSLKNCDQEE